MIHFCLMRLDNTICKPNDAKIIHEVKSLVTEAFYVEVEKVVSSIIVKNLTVVRTLLAHIG